MVELVDLPCFGRPGCCPARGCPVGSWTGQDERIAAPRLAMTDRAGRVTEQVGRHGQTVREVAVELGCDWHTINDAVLAYGKALVDDDPHRIGGGGCGTRRGAVGPRGRWRTQVWSTSIADVARSQLLDVIPDRSAAGACAWFAGRPEGWCEQIRWAMLDLSGPWRLAFDTVIPWDTQVGDPFHLVKVRHEAPCVRRRVRDPPLRAVAAAW
jgi:transposase